jgi:hypothetical protein
VFTNSTDVAAADYLFGGPVLPDAAGVVTHIGFPSAGPSYVETLNADGTLRQPVTFFAAVAYNFFSAYAVDHAGTLHATWQAGNNLIVATNPN